MATKWTTEQMPDQSGRTAVVTGANSGLGLAAARELAGAGAAVILACRDMAKAETALAGIEADFPGSKAEVRGIDLADLDSVRAFADGLLDDRGQVDLLINNAGVMAPPLRRTADGFEMQIGINHLGHFALTGRLLAAMEGRPGARVVTVSSEGHKVGRIDFDDLQSERRYRRWRAYCQSKLANVLFMLELDRRLRAADSTVSSLGAHPGYADTNLQYANPPVLDRAFFAVSNRLFAQPAWMGALPTLYAATAPALPGGSYVGPDGFAERAGHPTLRKPSRAGRDEATAGRLWEVSERLTGVRFEPLAAAV